MEVFSNPPIIEAQIGLTFASSATLDIINSASSLLANIYPEVKPRIQFQAEFKIDGDNSRPNSSAEEIGFQRQSLDSNHIVLLEKEHFIFCRLNKYPGWPDFRKSTQESMSVVSEIIVNQKPNKIFSRYINNFKLNLPMTLDEYFTFLPKLPSVNPGVAVNSLQYNFGLSQSETGNQAFISFFLKPTIKPSDTLEFILDLIITCPIMEMTSIQQALDTLDKSREFKNTLFLGLLTDKLKARYK